MSLFALFAAATVSAFAGGWRAYEGNPVLGDAALGTCFDVNVVTDDGG